MKQNSVYSQEARSPVEYQLLLDHSNFVLYTLIGRHTMKKHLRWLHQLYAAQEDVKSKFDELKKLDVGAGIEKEIDAICQSAGATILSDVNFIHGFNQMIQYFISNAQKLHNKPKSSAEQRRFVNAQLKTAAIPEKELGERFLTNVNRLEKTMRTVNMIGTPLIKKSTYNMLFTSMKRDPARERHIAHCLKLIRLLDFQLLGTVSDEMQHKYLQHIQSAEGGTLEKLKSIYQLKPSETVQTAFDEFLKKNTYRLQQGEYTPLFDLLIQHYSLKLKI